MGERAINAPGTEVTMTLRLPVAVLAALVTEASRLGLSVDALVAFCVSSAQTA